MELFHQIQTFKEKNMLPKKTILISAVLTAFILSMLGGVAVALKQPSVPTAVAAAETVIPTATAAVLLPQEAAAVAANVLNQQDIYSVETSSINGIDAYKVVFSSGQVAFVGLDGQILSISQIQPVVITQNNTAPVSKSSGSGHSSSSSSSSQHSGGEHEGGNNNGGNDD
jgi:hypothetical protein